MSRNTGRVLAAAAAVVVACAAAAAASPARAGAAAATPARAGAAAKRKPTAPKSSATSKPAAPSVPVPVRSSPRSLRGCPSEPTTTVGPRIAQVTKIPWPQQALDFSSAWDLSEGQGITVAVVDSGVNYSPQLAGRVSAIDLTGTGAEDCVGHGTAVAGIIAASDLQARGVLFTGVAPLARIMSIKVTNNPKSFSSALLAEGIYDAAFRGAQVINVSAVTPKSTPALLAAVDYAQSRNAVIVAAGGNDTSSGKGPFYPASYPGVLSVGAVEHDGALAPFSDRLSDVAVTAPGWNITSLVLGGYQDEMDGTSFSAAYVSGVAALVRARFPHLSAALVIRRIVDTADGDAGPGTGSGLVNPLLAVTEILPSPSSAAPSPRPQPVSVVRAPLANRMARVTAVTITACSLGAAALISVGVVVIRRGRRRRWRAARAPVPGDDPGDAAQEPSDAGMFGG
jgi:membrane-anchored mycosin MYCP